MNIPRPEHLPVDVAEAAIAARQAEQAAEAARRHRDELIRQRRAEGVGVRDLARAAGLHTQRIHQIVGKQRPQIDRDELVAWLGPAADELTDDQIDRLHQQAEFIHARWSDPDDDDLRDAALSAATQWLLGETSLDQAREQLVSARVAELRASAAAFQVAVMAVADGMPESDAAEAVGLDLATLHKALGRR